jgi:hypothetical protein
MHIFPYIFIVCGWEVGGGVVVVEFRTLIRGELSNLCAGVIFESGLWRGVRDRCVRTRVIVVFGVA